MATKHILPGWCKKAKIQMVMKDISTVELANAIGVTRQHTAAVLNGRVFSMSTVKKISEYLGISDKYD